MNIVDLLGKRYLLKLATGGFGRTDVQEFKIIEISPSGNWVKLQNTDGYKFWRAVTDVSFVEELKDLKADRPKD